MGEGLEQADLDRVWSLAEEVERATSLEEVMALTTTSLLDLLDAQSLSFNWVSEGRAQAVVHPRLPDEVMAHFEPILGRRWRENPLAEHMRRTADCRPLRWRDVADDGHWRASPFYREFYAVLGVHDQMAIRVPSHPGVLGALAANSDRDFTERERTILGLAGGHVAQRMHVLDERPGPHLGRPRTRWDVVTVDEAGRVLSAHGALVTTLGTRVGGPLPRVLAGLDLREHPEPVARPEGAPGGPLLPRGPHVLDSPLGPLIAVASGWRGPQLLFVRPAVGDDVVARDGSRLLEVGLTRREAEVALLLAEGESNQRIGTRLGISLGTVKKHCQNLYTTLEVDNRAAAAAAVVRLVG